MFLYHVGGHKRCYLLYDPSHFVLQQLDYLEYIDLYHERIRMFHVKDAEFNPTGRQGVYGGFQPWIDRKSTRLNSSHLGISYAVFCLKKKKIRKNNNRPDKST